MPEQYEDRIRRVTQYIFDNPAGDLSLDALADVAAMSRFHWHRVFAAMTGETCAAAVRRIRAHRAACWLVQSDQAIPQIARRCGYDNDQSFARAFRAQYGMTPLAFRRTGRADPNDTRFRKGNPTMHPVEIRTLDSLRIAALPHKGAYSEIGRAFQQVAAVFTARGLWPHARGMVGVYYNSPAEVAELDLRSDAGVVVTPDFSMPDALNAVVLAAGRHAVMTVKGPYAGLPQAWDTLYSSWLPQSGEMPADAPPFERYLNDVMDTPPADLLTEIHVPLADERGKH